MRELGKNVKMQLLQNENDSHFVYTNFRKVYTFYILFSKNCYKKRLTFINKVEKQGLLHLTLRKSEKWLCESPLPNPPRHPSGRRPVTAPPGRGDGLKEKSSLLAGTGAGVTRRLWNSRHRLWTSLSLLSPPHPYPFVCYPHPTPTLLSATQPHHLRRIPATPESDKFL